MKENEAKIREKEDHISALLSSLGRKGAESALSAGISGSERLMQECLASVKEREKAEERLIAIRNASDEHEGRKALLDVKRKEEARLSSGIDMLLSSLGASLYEKCSFSLLDKDAFSFIYKDLGKDSEERKTLVPFVSSALRKRRFRRYGRLVIEHDLDGLLDGNAGKIAKELRDLYSQKIGIENERKELYRLIGAKKQSYAALSKEGIERAERNVKSAEEKEEAAFRNYGSLLWEKGQSWICDETPSRILDDIERILSCKRELDALVSERARLKREAKADDLMALLENEEKKLSILGKERERLDAEISDISKEIAQLKAKLDEIRREQES